MAQHRYAGSGAPRVFQVSEQFQAPDPVNFFSVSANKAGLLNFLCETWSEDEQMEPSMSSTRLYLGGGFNEETKSVLITDGLGVYSSRGRHPSHSALCV